MFAAALLPHRNRASLGLLDHQPAPGIGRATAPKPPEFSEGIQRKPPLRGCITGDHCGTPKRCCELPGQLFPSGAMPAQKRDHLQTLGIKHQNSRITLFVVDQRGDQSGDGSQSANHNQATALAPVGLQELTGARHQHGLWAGIEGCSGTGGERDAFAQALVGQALKQRPGAP